MKTTYRIIPCSPWWSEDSGYMAQVRAWWTLGLWIGIGEHYLSRVGAQDEIDCRRNVQS